MKNKISVLLVEDDINLGTLLCEFLSVKGFIVDQAFNGAEGFELFSKNKYDICLIDVMMPKMDGFTLARKIRVIDKETPFLFLTAKSMLDDKIEGFKLGADDYVTKPFSMEELILRVNAIIKRTKKTEDEENHSTFGIGKYTFNYEKRILMLKDQEQKLTQKECELLNLLCINKNKVLERSEALTRIWKDDNYFTSRSMDVYITKLRGYLKQDESIELVNIHGTGYKLFVK
jgi:two-component system, OmpR family, response regulator